MSKVQGSVKWFSNRKGYGFITPAEGSPISEDIFVHQSSLQCDGYRTVVSRECYSVWIHPLYKLPSTFY